MYPPNKVAGKTGKVQCFLFSPVLAYLVGRYKVNLVPRSPTVKGKNSVKQSETWARD